MSKEATKTVTITEQDITALLLEVCQEAACTLDDYALDHMSDNPTDPTLCLPTLERALHLVKYFRDNS